MRNQQECIREADRCDVRAKLAQDYALRSIFDQLAMRWRAIAETNESRPHNYLRLMEIGIESDQSAIAETNDPLPLQSIVYDLRAAGVVKAA